MFISNWVFVLDAKSEKNAKIVMNRIFKLLEIEPISCEYQGYTKTDFDGYRVRVDFSHDIAEWNEYVLTIMQLGLNLGSSWAINGNMFEQVTAILSRNTAHIRCIGVEWVSWEIYRNQ